MIDIEQLQAGMVVKIDVRDRSGRLLLGGGTTVEDRHIRLFRSWGVREVEIRGADESEAPREPRPVELTVEVIDRAVELTRERFRHANTDHPAMQELFRLAVMRQAHRMNRGG